LGKQLANEPQPHNFRRPTITFGAQGWTQHSGALRTKNQKSTGIQVIGSWGKSFAQDGQKDLPLRAKRRGGKGGCGGREVPPLRQLKKKAPVSRAKGSGEPKSRAHWRALEDYWGTANAENLQKTRWVQVFDDLARTSGQGEHNSKKKGTEFPVGGGSGEESKER